nr:MAG: hypothetical protein ADFBMEEK_00068 [Peromyscus leucopus gammaherpesvirus]
MTEGIRRLLFKVLRQQKLNTYTNQELRYLHLILCKMYEYCINMYLLKEAIANTGTSDDSVLCRKVPTEVWKIIYDGCLEMGISHEDMISEKKSCVLWEHLNKQEGLLQGLTNYIFHRIGVESQVTIRHAVLTDGNYLYNLGGVIPNRLLMAIGFCLINWGKQENEHWVRLFSGKIFILYLMLRGWIRIGPGSCVKASETNYPGVTDMVAHELRILFGIRTSMQGSTKHTNELDYLFIFNNSVVLP